MLPTMLPTPEEIKYYEANASDNLQPSIIIRDAVGLVVGSLFVGLRIYSRRLSGVRLSANDFLIIWALILLFACSTISFVGLRYGNGKHVIFVSNPQGAAQVYVAIVILYAITIVLTKLSVLFFYYTIFPSRALLIVSFLVGGFSILYTLVIIIFQGLQCIPISSLWEWKWENCADVKTFSLVVSIVNVATDFLIVSLPVYYVIRLRLDLARKLEVLFTFVLGGLVCVFAILRTYYAWETFTLRDPTYELMVASHWTYAEAAVGIVAACIPTLGHVVAKGRQQVLKRNSAQSELSQVEQARPPPAEIELPQIPELEGTVINLNRSVRFEVPAEAPLGRQELNQGAEKV